MQDNVVQVRRLSKEFKRDGGEKFFAVNHVNLDIRRGEIFGLLEPNGVGADPTPSAPTIRIDIVDNDQSELSEPFIRRLRAANSNFVLCPMDRTVTDACAFAGVGFTPALAQERLEDSISLALIEMLEGFAVRLASQPSPQQTEFGRCA